MCCFIQKRANHYCPKTKTKVGSTSDNQTKCFKGIKLYPYAGDQHVDQYLAQFKLVTDLSGWPKEWGGRLTASLEGKVRRILTLEPLPSRPSFQQASRLLRASFASELFPEVYRQEPENKRRGEKEKLTDLSHFITNVMAKAYPSLALEERKQLAVGYFIRALTDPQQLRVAESSPRDLTKALKLALSWKNASRWISSKRQSVRPRVRAVVEEDEGVAPQGQSLGWGSTKERERKKNS